MTSPFLSIDGFKKIGWLESYSQKDNTLTITRSLQMNSQSNLGSLFIKVGLWGAKQIQTWASTNVIIFLSHDRKLMTVNSQKK